VQVFILDNGNPESGAQKYNLDGIENKINLTMADVRDMGILNSLIPGKDYLFNLAALSSHLGAMDDPGEDLRVNGLAQLGILEACRHFNPNIRIVFTGTRQVYGKVNKLPVPEAAAVDPIDFNGVSKLAGEYYHILAHRIYGLWTTSLRLTNTYGPRMRVKDARQNFIGLWIRLLLDGKNLAILGRGSNS